MFKAFKSKAGQYMLPVNLYSSSEARTGGNFLEKIVAILTNMHLEMGLKPLRRGGIGKNDILQPVIQPASHELWMLT